MLPFLMLLLLSSKLAWSEVVLEEGYSVSTVLDGNKLMPPIHPFSLLPRGSKQHLLLLDSTASSFYTLSLPISQNSEVVRFSGNGIAGFADGDSAAAMFDHPRSFTVDSMGNVYVVDRSNCAIRKISSSGVTTTIAGGYSEKTGHNDGPAQNATFSNDFELVFVPKICALLISDRGNRLVRQMDLKAEDCWHESESGLGMTSVSVVAVICVLFGLVVGFIARPFLAFHDFSGGRRFNNKTWKHYQINLGTVPWIICSGMRSAVADSTPYMCLYRISVLSISYLLCMSRVFPRLEKTVPSSKTISLIDSEITSNHGKAPSLNFAEQLNDLIHFDACLDVVEIPNSSEPEYAERFVSNGTVETIDKMIQTNISDFSEQVLPGQFEGPSICSSGLVKRKASSP